MLPFNFILEHIHCVRCEIHSTLDGATIFPFPALENCSLSLCIFLTIGPLNTFEGLVAIHGNEHGKREIRFSLKCVRTWGTDVAEMPLRSVMLEDVVNSTVDFCMDGQVCVKCDGKCIAKRGAICHLIMKGIS